MCGVGGQPRGRGDQPRAPRPPPPPRAHTHTHAPPPAAGAGIAAAPPAATATLRHTFEVVDAARVRITFTATELRTGGGLGGWLDALPTLQLPQARALSPLAFLSSLCLPFFVPPPNVPPPPPRNPARARPSSPPCPSAPSQHAHADAHPPTSPTHPPTSPTHPSHAQLPEALRPPPGLRSAEFEVCFLDGGMRVTRGDRGELRIFLKGAT